MGWTQDQKEKSKVTDRSYDSPISGGAFFSEGWQEAYIISSELTSNSNGEPVIKFTFTPDKEGKGTKIAYTVFFNDKDSPEKRSGMYVSILSCLLDDFEFMHEVTTKGLEDCTSVFPLFERVFKGMKVQILVERDKSGYIVDKENSKFYIVDVTTGQKIFEKEFLSNKDARDYVKVHNLSVPMTQQIKYAFLNIARYNGFKSIDKEQCEDNILIAKASMLLEEEGNNGDVPF